MCVYVRVRACCVHVCVCVDMVWFLYFVLYKPISSQTEALLKFKDLDVEKCNLVQNYSVFMHKGFYCLVFEYLEQTLSAFMMSRSYDPLPLASIRLIVQQVVIIVCHSLFTTVNVVQ